MGELDWIERYDLPSSRQTHEGWAVIHIDSRGFLGVFSDFGNYAFHWRSFGEDFKAFLKGLEPEYLHSKLAHQVRVYDGEATYQALRSGLLNARERLEPTCLEFCQRVWPRFIEALKAGRRAPVRTDNVA